MKTNRGLDLTRERAEQDGTEYVFGAFSSPCITDIKVGEREKYLPAGERQNIGEEKMDCSPRSVLNCLETKFNWLYAQGKIYPENEKWLRDKGYFTKDNKIEFSDRHIAILSKVTRQGTSLKAPLQAVHEHGLIPKSLLPQAFTFNEHHDPKSITKEMEVLGQQFLSRFKINYEKVFEARYKEALKEDMLGVAGHAWEKPVNGIYQKTDKEPNHAFLVYEYNDGFSAFDNYES